MNKNRLQTIEKEKELLTINYEKAMLRLYEPEIRTAINWFKNKYPKRTIQWRSGNGVCFWILDGNILHWDTLDMHYTPGCWETYYTEAIPNRKAKKLLPLWNVFQSIHDNTNVLGFGIQSNDTK